MHHIIHGRTKVLSLMRRKKRLSFSPPFRRSFNQLSLISLSSCFLHFEVIKPLVISSIHQRKSARKQLSRPNNAGILQPTELLSNIVVVVVPNQQLNSNFSSSSSSSCWRDRAKATARSCFPHKIHTYIASRTQRPAASTSTEKE